MEKNWYIVHVYSGFEHKVSESIREQAKKIGLEECFGDILIPTENVIEIHAGKKVNVPKKFFPGYILISMVMNDRAWHLVRHTAKVSGFLGGGNKPMPISNAEAKKIISQMKERIISSSVQLTFEVGEQIKICEGPFASFMGIVEAVDEEKTRLKVSVSIFGRSTLVELEYSQVEKI